MRERSDKIVELRLKYELILPYLNEHSKRLFAGASAYFNDNNNKGDETIEENK